MIPSEVPAPDEFESVAPELLEAIARARKRVAELPGALNGELERFRDRLDRLIRESEVDNWRQVRIFLRDVDSIAADLRKAHDEKRLVPKHVAILDASLRKMRRRDFYGARKVWRKLDKVVEQTGEIRRLQGLYRDGYHGVEARIRELRRDVEHLEKVPKPPASLVEANAFVAEVDAFNDAAQLAYRDFLSRARADTAIPLLLEAATGRGIGIPAPPQGSDAEPLLRLLAGAGPGHDEIRVRSFYGLLELPRYSDAKLTHVYGDSRMVRSALEACWAWLKAIREDERRSLQILWSDDATMLRRRLPAIVAFLEQIRPMNDAPARGSALVEALQSGRFAERQTAARLYATHRGSAERKFAGDLEKDIEKMKKEASSLAAVLKKFPDPAKVDAGELEHSAR